MSKKIATVLIHGGQQQDKVNHAIFPAITTASTFVPDQPERTRRICLFPRQ